MKDNVLRMHAPTSQNSNLEIHTETQHELWTNFNCTVCNVTMRSVLDFDVHMSHYHQIDYPVLHCIHCQETFRNMILLNIHIMNNHGFEKISPDVSNRSDISDIFQIDGNNSIVDGFTNCDFCDFRTETEDMLRMHYRKKHEV